MYTPLLASEPASPISPVPSQQRKEHPMFGDAVQALNGPAQTSAAHLLQQVAGLHTAV